MFKSRETALQMTHPVRQTQIVQICHHIQVQKSTTKIFYFGKPKLSKNYCFTSCIAHRRTPRKASFHILVLEGVLIEEQPTCTTSLHIPPVWTENSSSSSSYIRRDWHYLKAKPIIIIYLKYGNKMHK